MVNLLYPATTNRSLGAESGRLESEARGLKAGACARGLEIAGLGFEFTPDDLESPDPQGSILV